MIHGAYQYFEPSQDPIAQADVLLAKTGAFQADDLPPTIDVEATGGLAPAQVASKVKQWIDHVKATIGRDPIVYTGFHLWRDGENNAGETGAAADAEFQQVMQCVREVYSPYFGADGHGHWSACMKSLITVALGSSIGCTTSSPTDASGAV